ncbi:MAG: helix-turn-helix domain-containing protein [Gemmataceae bacterium]
MKAQHIFRANRKTPAKRRREKALRDKLQKEKPSLEDLIRAGDCDPDAVMTMGMYFDLQGALQALKQERRRSGLSIGDVAKHSGLDRAVVSRLENGKQDNPTVATLMRYAAALGKRFLWCYEDLAGNGTPGDGQKPRPPQAKRGN